MDIPETCNYCGTEYNGSTCWNCVTMANYASKFPQCFMCGKKGFGELEYREQDELLAFQLLENGEKVSVGNKESEPLPLFIRIMDGVKMEPMENGGISYNDVINYNNFLYQRAERSKEVSPEEITQAMNAFRPDEISNHTAVLCRDCMQKKKETLEKEGIDPQEVELWQKSWVPMQYGTPFSI